MKILKNDNFVNALILKNISFLKFCIVGASNTIISLIIYWILLKFDIYYLVASTIAYMAGILNGYLLSSKYVFKTTKSIQTIFKFFVVYGTSLLINLFLLYVLVDIVGINKMIAQVMTIVVNTLFNYFVNKIWTFK